MEPPKIELARLSEIQKRRLLELLARLSWSDRVVMPSEKTLFFQLAEWLGVEAHEAQALFARSENEPPAEAADFPAELRSLVFTTAAVMVWIDGKFSAPERTDLARLAAALRISPDGARAALREIKKRSALRKQVEEALAQSTELAGRQSAEQISLRSLITVMGVFFGLGAGILASPSLLPGAIMGALAGVLGGGLVGNAVASAKRFEPDDYDFDNL